eukprot:gene20905-biopygen29637
MFSITVPNVDLPVDLGFTQDFDLKLAIGDDGDVVVCGRHWTLFTTVTQPMADFEAAYGILQQTAMVSCAAAAAAEPPPLDIDDSCMPFDKLTYAVVVALEELVDNSCCPNTRVFAWLYAKHLRAADMDFMDLLQTPAIANMASTALDAWFVRHPMFRAQAHEAQDLLITVLDDYRPSRPRYEPYWNGSGMFSTKVTPEKVHKELAKIPPGDLINRMSININTNQINKTSTIDEQNAITKLVQIIETATKQKEDFDKATHDFYTVYDKLKIAIMEACETGPKLCGTVNGAIKPQKKNS